MALTLACKDTGIDCSWVGRADTEEALLADAGEHAKEVHAYTDEQLNDPKLGEAIKAAIKRE
jgi:predicted small metal-binding protein